MTNKELLKKLLNQFEDRRNIFKNDFENHPGDDFNEGNVIPRLQCYGNWQAMEEVISNVKYELRHIL